MATGNCPHGVPLLMVCPTCDHQNTVDNGRLSTEMKSAVLELEARIKAACILEVRWQLATHQRDDGTWESGQIASIEQDSGRVWINNKTRAIAATPYEAVEMAAVRAARLAEKRLATVEVSDHAAS